jgi:hypothetical protein
MVVDGRRRPAEAGFQDPQAGQGPGAAVPVAALLVQAMSPFDVFPGGVLAFERYLHRASRRSAAFGRAVVMR